jgi:hypothetical protein
MAYVPGTDKPFLMVPGVGGGPSLWYFRHATDAHGSIDAEGYFTDGASYGLKANDIMIVIDVDTATCTLHHVLSATTIAAATLA